MLLAMMQGMGSQTQQGNSRGGMSGPQACNDC